MPVYAAIRALPKDELAAAAEALVNLNSFRQRVSLDAETVGGPIDVAVISKGDGFIWIKRKHYFNPDLNIHFPRNYYRGLDVPPDAVRADGAAQPKDDDHDSGTPRQKSPQRRRARNKERARPQPRA